MKERIFLLGNGDEICDYLDKHDVEKIYYRSGVWNDYTIIDYNRNKLFKTIKKSAAGADLYVVDSKYLVSIPTESDMW